MKAKLVTPYGTIEAEGTSLDVAALFKEYSAWSQLWKAPVSVPSALFEYPVEWNSTATSSPP